MSPVMVLETEAAVHPEVVGAITVGHSREHFCFADRRATVNGSTLQGCQDWTPRREAAARLAFGSVGVSVAPREPVQSRDLPDRGPRQGCNRTESNRPN